jgi:hypothetical protein
LLYLIQGLAWIEVSDGAEVMAYRSEGRFLAPRRILEQLQFRGPGV